MNGFKCSFKAYYIYLFVYDLSQANFKFCTKLQISKAEEGQRESALVLNWVISELQVKL